MTMSRSTCNPHGMTVEVGVGPVTLNDYTAAEIRAEMGRQQISGRRLAEKMGRSANWVSLKTSGASPLGLNDVEVIAKALGLEPAELIHRADATRQGRKPTRSYVPGRVGSYALPEHPIVRTAVRLAPLVDSVRRTAPTGR